MSIISENNNKQTVMTTNMAGVNGIERVPIVGDAMLKDLKDSVLKSGLPTTYIPVGIGADSSLLLEDGINGALISVKSNNSGEVDRKDVSVEIPGAKIEAALTKVEYIDETDKNRSMVSRYALLPEGFALDKPTNMSDFLAFGEKLTELYEGYIFSLNYMLAATPVFNTNVRNSSIVNPSLLFGIDRVIAFNGSTVGFGQFESISKYAGHVSKETMKLTLDKFIVYANTRVNDRNGNVYRDGLNKEKLYSDLIAFLNNSNSGIKIDGSKLDTIILKEDSLQDLKIPTHALSLIKTHYQLEQFKEAMFRSGLQAYKKLIGDCKIYISDAGLAQIKEAEDKKNNNVRATNEVNPAHIVREESIKGVTIGAVAGSSFKSII